MKDTLTKAADISELHVTFNDDDTQSKTDSFKSNTYYSAADLFQKGMFKPTWSKTQRVLTLHRSQIELVSSKRTADDKNNILKKIHLRFHSAMKQYYGLFGCEIKFIVYS